MLLTGPNPREGETTGELTEGLITENGEPKMLVGLLEAELLGCCEDMALKISTVEDDVPSQGYQSASDREQITLVRDSIQVVSIIWVIKTTK